MSRIFKLALVQLAVSSNKKLNISNARTKIIAAKNKLADVVCLPECFNSPYGVHHFNNYAESFPDGETFQMLSSAAKEAGIYVIGGSVPERDSNDDRILRNTCTVWSPNGDLVAKYSKVHLFDIDIPNKIKFIESDVLSPGKNLQIASTPWGKIGIGICFDLRFPELASLYAQEGCELLVYPGAFNMTTGPMHWELLGRSVAINNQLYTALCSPARDASSDYVAYGHSMVCDPWAKVIAKADEHPDIIVTDIDFNVVDEVRQSIPLKKRTDVYNLPSKVD